MSDKLLPTKTSAGTTPRPSSSAKMPIALGLGALLVVASAAGWWFGYEQPRRQRVEQKAIQALKTAGALVLTNSQSGNVQVNLAGKAVEDDMVAQLNAIRGLRQLNLSGAAITDAQLSQLQGGNLVQIVLNDTSITGAGLGCLKGMSQLEAFNARNSRAGHGGMEMVGSAANLTNLDLTNAAVTDEGLAHLQGLSRLAHLTLDENEITDAGLKHLHPLTGLGRLDLVNCQVTAKGVTALRKAIPGLQVNH